MEFLEAFAAELYQAAQYKSDKWVHFHIAAQKFRGQAFQNFLGSSAAKMNGVPCNKVRSKR
jgi:hypothetical protein